LQKFEPDCGVIVDSADSESPNKKGTIHVLHVDDDPSVLEISKLLLMDMGNFEIEHARCVDEAFKKIETGQYDVIISDYEMPQKNGLEFLQELREQNNEIPFILFTGKGREEVAIKALNLGADGYYNKNGSTETVYGELYHGIRMAVTRKATEAALIEAQTLTNSVINSTKDMIWSVSADNFALLTFNKTMSDYFFRTQKLKLKAGMTTKEIMPTEQLTNKWIELNKRALREGSFTIEYTTLKEPMVLELTFNLLKRGEKVFGIAVFGKDITDRKKAEEALRNSEERFRQLAVSSPDIIHLLDPISHKVDFLNRNEILGYSRVELESANSILPWLHPDDRELVQAYYKLVLKGTPDGQKPVEYRLKSKGGNWEWVQSRATILNYDEQNKPTQILVTLTVISERKKAEKLLVESESKYLRLFNTAEVGMFRTKLHSSEILECNEKLLQILGYTRKEMQGTPSTLYYADASQRQELTKILQAKGQLVDSEIKLVSKLGEVKTCLVSSKLYPDEGILEGSIIDITERKKVERALAESEEKYKSLFENAPDAIVTTDMTGKITSVNKTIIQFGFSEKDLVERPLLGLLPSEYTQKMLKGFKNMAAGNHYQNEIEIITPMGKRSIEYNSNPIWREGKVVGYQTLIRDITERKKTEDALRESMERNQVYLDNTPLALFVSKSDGKAEFTNKAACNLLGYSQEELSRINFADVVLKEDLSQALESFNAFKSKDNGVSFREFRLRRKDGKIVNVALNAARLPDGKLITFCEDITESKKVERELKMFALAIQKSTDGIVIGDLNGNITFVNDALLELLGSNDKNDLIGKHVLELIAERDRARAIQNSLECVRTGKGFVGQYAALRADGLEFQVEVATSRIDDGEGQGVGFIDIIRNVSDRIKAEESVRQNEEKFRTLAEESPNIIFINKGGRVVYANKKSEEITGYSREDLYSPEFNFLSLNPPEHVEAVQLAYAKHMRGEFVPPYEYALITRDGQRINAIINTSIIEYNGDKAILGIITDITERKKAEEEMKIAASIFDLATDSIFVHDMDGNIVNFNEAAYKLRGYSKEEMAKMNIQDLDSPESAKLVKPRINELIRNGSAVFEAVEVCKDKSLLPVELHVRLIELGGKKLILSVARDITDRKEAEKKLKENNAKFELMNEKLRVVGSLTRHDVRNKLSAVNGYTYLLKKKHRDQADIVDGLSKIEKAVAESAEIFDFAKMYEQLGVEEVSYIDVGKAVDEATALFSDLTFRIVNDCHGMRVLADSFLRQMFYNFIDNTRKYGEKATIIKVHCEKVESGELRLIYEDNGVGILAENKPKLFKEGFSTGGSTGFGLFLTKHMIDVYGWQIQENGTPSEEAKFTITIPKLNKNGKENYQIAQ